MSANGAQGEFAAAVTYSLQFIHKSLKEELMECISRIVWLKEDILAVLPMGFGKIRVSFTNCPESDEKNALFWLILTLCSCGESEPTIRESKKKADCAAATG